MYDFTAARLLLGCLIQRPNLSVDDKYPLNKKDFSEQLFHMRLYQAIHALAQRGANSISAMECYNLCKGNQAVKELFDLNNLSAFIETVSKVADVNNFNLYYSTVRKCSLINAFKEAGFDTAKFEQDISRYTEEEISSHFLSQAEKISREFKCGAEREEYLAGADFIATKNKFKESPDYGPSFQSPYLNSIYRGQSGLILRAGKSGFGKSVQSMGDVCKCCCREYWDDELKQFVPNKSAVGPALFINTEMDLRKELDPLIIAWISGVSRGKIKDGYYRGDEEERVERAAQILLDSKLYIVDDPCFTTTSIVSTIKEYKNIHGIKLACFDYIQNNGFVASEIAGETKIPQREDMVLLALTDRLKQVQRMCDIPVLTSVQTNGMEDTMKYPTEACLAGSKGQIRKTDATMVILPPKQDEIDLFNMAKENPNLGIGENAVCNTVTHILKGRNSKFPRHVKIYQQVDYGTGRTHDWFSTDKDGNQVDGLHGLLIECDGRKQI